MFLISSISQGPKAEACPRGSVLFFVIDVINDSILLFFFLFRKEFVCLYFHTSVRDCVSFFYFTSVAKIPFNSSKLANKEYCNRHIFLRNRFFPCTEAKSGILLIVCNTYVFFNYSSLPQSPGTISFLIWAEREYP